MLGRGVKNVDLLKCVWTKMTISLKQVDLVIGQQVITPWKPQIKKPTIDTQKLGRKEHKHTTNKIIWMQGLK